MIQYPKINAPYKRYIEGKKKGRFIEGQWAQPEFEFLANNQWDFTEKIDGQNVVIEWEPYHEPYFFGRTERALLPSGLVNYLTDKFTNETMSPVFDGPVTLYGEGYGTGIQNGGKYRADQSFILFDVLIGGWWLNRDNLVDVAEKLSIDVVPMVGSGTLYDAFDIVRSGIVFNAGGGIERFGRARLDSKFGDFEAEGLVCRPSVPLFNRKGERITTKVKAVDFK